MKEKTIKITNKTPYSGNASKPPAGDFYEGSEKYTCWDSEIFNKFSIGETVTVSYTEKENEYNGKKYINRNVSTMESQNYGANKGVPVEVIKIQDNVYNNIINIGGLQYEQTLRLIS